MKKGYLIPTLIIVLSMLMNTTYAALTISNQTIGTQPPLTIDENNIFCIEKGAPVGENNIVEGTVSYEPQNENKTIYNQASYSSVGMYDLPIEIAYALTSGATLEQMQYAIWYSGMNEGNILTGTPTITELADLPQYNQILNIQSEIQSLEDNMQQYVLQKDSVNRLIAEIQMQNTNIVSLLDNAKIQKQTWPNDLPDVTYIQARYNTNIGKINELEANSGDINEINRIKTENETLKAIIDEPNYDSYIAFLEGCIQENDITISNLQNTIIEYETGLAEYETNINELRTQLQEIKQTLQDEYASLYEDASSLLHDGMTYKSFYEAVESAGGYKPTASDYETKLVKKNNNTYIAGPFELTYIEGEAGEVNFSYIENMYLEDQDGDIIEDIEIIECEELNGNYPASGEKFYIKFKAKEKDILEDEDVNTRTWREGRYRYTETTTVKTYGVKLKVDFEYLQICGGKYARLEGQGDIITWNKKTETIDGEPVSYWVAQNEGAYEAQTLIAVDRNSTEVKLEIPTGEISTNDLELNYELPTRAWGGYSLEVGANGRDEEEDLDRVPTRGDNPTPTPTPNDNGDPTPTPTPNDNGDPTPTPTPNDNGDPTPTPTPTPTPEPLELTTEVAGYVFADIPVNKDNTANGLLDYNSSDKLLEGIEVAIYEENGDLVRLIQEYEENSEISVEKAEIRTNPTLTDANGYYSFKGLDPDKKYYIEFRYNGLIYEATTYKASVGNSDGTVYTGEAWKINSKAVENINDRTKLNGVYGEIAAYPNSYKKAYDIGLGIGEYNKIYLQTDLVNTYALITTYIQDYISNNRKYPDILEIYQNIYNDQIAHDSEIANKLQFIEDSKISSYTSSNGDEKDLYPIYEEFAIEEEKVRIDETYEPIYVGQKYINFGIKAREEFDLSIAKDVYSAEVKINGKVQNYNYNNVEIDYTDESWSAYVNGSDIGYDRNIYAADYLAKDIGVDNLEVYVTYRIALRNQTSLISAGVTKVVDYYDSEYTYVGNTENSYTGTNQGKVYVGNSRGELIANAIWQDGAKNGNYNAGYITFENSELNVKNGEDKFIYVTFKVNKNDNGLLSSDGEVIIGENGEAIVTKQATDAKQNIVEIAGYKTYYESSKTFSNGKTIEAGSIAGIIDRDSIAGNLNPNIEEDINKEDDSDRASGFSLLVDWTNFRSVSGNVWEELPTENSLNEGTRLGNGEKDSNEKNIKNVTVKVLIEGTETIAKGYVKEADGTYVWKDLIAVTDDNGNYSFTGYIPGDYIVRYTYGNVSEDGSGVLADEMKIYNSQDYKSTIYNNDSTVSLQGLYWYAINSDILKSDAKDSWTRREEVNSYSLELDNQKSNVLKEDSVDEMLKAEKTWMTAETDKLVFEIEYARGTTESVINSNDNHVYNVKNIDLGLVERPRSQILVEKDVKNIKLILSDGTVLYDAILNSNGELETVINNLAIIKRIAKTHDMKTTPAQFNIGKNGQITMNIDEELMQGSQIHITYKVSVSNIGEIDYNTQEFYYNGTKGTEEQKAKTTATTVVDYVSNNLGITQISSDWVLADKEELKGKDGNPAEVVILSDTAELSDAEYTAQIIDSYNNILKTNALGTALKPGEETTLDLLLTTAISPENDEDDLRYDNILELVQSKNDVGRRHELSVLGNQNPTKEVEELDSGKAETVLIIPPFGMNDNLPTMISIAIAIVAAFGIGVYYIKKRVLK